MQRERNFAYAVARIRALETKLLDNAVFERLANAANLTDALSLLGETEYAGALGQLKDAHQFESALNAELSRVIQLLLELSDNAPELKVFVHKYDIHNLKSILKSEKIKPGSLSKLGIWPPEKLKQDLENNDLKEYPVIFQNGISEAGNAYKETGDIQDIDRILDATWFEYGYTTLKNGLSEMLFDWWIAFIDLTNLRSFVRLRLIGAVPSELERFFLRNGRLSMGSFKELWEEPYEKLANWLNNTPYSGILSDTQSPLASLTKLEREYDNFLIQLIDPAKRISLGIEPLVGYLLAKENEVKILRIILIGKANQVANSEIKERMRRAYA